MFTKRLLAGFLAAVLCFALVACDDSTDSGTTSSTTQSASESTSETNSSSENGSTSTSSSETTSKQEFPESPEGFSALPISDDLETVTIGKYVTLRYNGAAADVFYKVEKGIGSRENITLTVSPKNGYSFNGWSEEDAIVNGKLAVSTSETYTFTATYKTTLFLNSSVTLNYHENGGSFSGNFSGSETFSVAFFHNPNTKIEGNFFKKDGYTLIGYNTKADGTGDYVALGERVDTKGQGTVDLWCVWAENTPEDQFTYYENNGNIIIQKYNGNAETVVIPEKIAGKTVKQIFSGAFLNNSTVKTVVVAKTVVSVDSGAFNKCSALETVILFDNALTSVSDGSFKNCSALENIRINTSYELPNQWFSCGAAKFDRLVWAKDKKKIVIVGGSGSLYGYNSAVLDEALGGEYEIINLGENANVPSLVYFDIIEEYIGEGDIVLWCPEPGVYTMGTRAGEFSSRLWDFFKSDYGFTQHLNPDYYSSFFSTFANNCATLAKSTFKSFERLSANMSKYGDDLSVRSSKLVTYDYTFSYPLTESAAYSEIFTNIQNKGGKVFFSFAAMAKQNAESYASAAAAFEAQITSLPNVTSISTFEDCLYDYTYFWDSAWHLTDVGATIRSERVANDLLKALGKTK